MARTGPQYYPAANHTAYNYESLYSVSAIEVDKLLLHTTEGTSVPTYADRNGRKGASAPNFTLMPDIARKRATWYQHFRVDSSARALENRAGGVETNTDDVVQVELVGTCDPKTHAKWTAQNVPHIYWPEAPDWLLEEIAEFLAWLHEEHGVPLVAAPEWLAYPSSYGNTSARFTFDEWRKFKGVCGHQHAPENSHGDPGNIKIRWIIERAKQILGIDKEKPDGPGAPKPTTPKPVIPPFPGRKYFGAGQRNQYVEQLGRQLVKKGFAKYHDGDGYQPGPRWTEYDRKNVQAFQRSRAELRGDADGLPGPLTWQLLFK